MYCPNPECPDLVEGGVRGEYVEGISVCPRCGTGLVEAAALDLTDAWQGFQQPGFGAVDIY